MADGNSKADVVVQPSDSSPGTKLYEAMLEHTPHKELCKYFGDLYDALCGMCRQKPDVDLSFFDDMCPGYLAVLFEPVKAMNIRLTDVTVSDIEACAEYSLYKYVKGSENEAMFRLSCRVLTDVICDKPRDGQTYSVGYESFRFNQYEHSICIENGGGDKELIILRYVVSKLIYREGKTPSNE